MAQVVLGAAPEQFNDPTATLLLQVDCIERDSQELRCVGYAVIPLFMDPRENAQPRRKNLLDYVLNQVCLSASSCSLFSSCLAGSQAALHQYPLGLCWHSQADYSFVGVMHHKCADQCQANHRPWQKTWK